MSLVATISREEAEDLTQKIQAAARELVDSSTELDVLRRRHPAIYAAVAAARVSPTSAPSARVPVSSLPVISPVVYFVQAGENGPVKIGVATDLKKRIAALQTGCPEPLRILGTTPGGMGTEALFHSRLRAHRLRGEWFHPSPEVMASVPEASE